MARIGRPKADIPRKSRIVYLPVDLSAEVDLLLMDPLKEKIQYGAFTTLVEKLVREWVDGQRTNSVVDNSTASGV